MIIVDPHLKADDDYTVYKRAKDKGLLVADREGKPLVGHCWPGDSSWLDFSTEAGRQYWASLFDPSLQKADSDVAPMTEYLFTWIDMNEPSVFSGPELTLPKDSLHANGAVEHREIHNLFGYYQSAATAAGHARLRPGKRPFVLTR